VGPVLGGLLVRLGGTDLGWRLVFYVNLPIGIVALLLVPRLLPGSERSQKPSLDPVGVLLFGAAMLLVLLPMVEGRQGAPLSARPWWLLGVAAALLAMFYGWERWWFSAGRATLVDLSLAKVRSYVLGLSLGTFYFAGFTSIFLITTLYLQIGLGYDALEAGLTQMPFAIGSGVAAWSGGRLVSRYGRSLVIVGLGLVVAGLVAIDLLVPHLDTDVGIKLAPALLLAGLGSGLVISPNVTLTLQDVDVRHAGSGGGMLQTAQRVGSAIGIAIVLAQFFDQLGSDRGDFAGALSFSLRTTLGFVVVAMLFGVADLVTGRRAGPNRVSPASAPTARG
ncbi:MAG: MFS transporter, partial [Nocardioidaceae bacterium]